MSRFRSSLVRASSLALMLGIVGCWAAAGIEEREATRFGWPFVETVELKCSNCVERSCHAELGACNVSKDCLRCTGLVSDIEIACTDPPEFDAIKSCVHDRCEIECYPTVFDLDDPAVNAVRQTSGGTCVSIGDWYGRLHCNPVTNEPCDGLRGETCSFDYGYNYFACHAGGRVNGVGDVCGLVEGLCGPGTDCANGRCYAYCCGDEDCGQAGSCFFLEQQAYQLNLGLCVAKN